MYKIILLVCMIGNLFANDLVELYRTKGLPAVEKELKNKLLSKSYWIDYLDNKNVDYGYYENKEFVIITEKQKKELRLYKLEDNNLSLLSKHEVIVGEKEGDKFLEGDKKTPEGVYDLLNKKTNLDQFYGPFALVTSYPNTFDKTLNKKGHGIWIHGMPLNEEREKYTRGCIALDNPQLEEFEKKIDLEKTIMLTSQNELQKASKEEIAMILSSVYQWRDAWKFSNFNKYISFYSEDFIKDDGTKYKKFKNYKKRIFRKREKKRISLENINITPYPNSLNKRIYKVIMDETYRSPTVRFDGKKELYFEIKDNEAKIIVEG